MLYDKKIENLHLKCIDFVARIRNSNTPFVIPNCRQLYYFKNNILFCKYELVNVVLLSNKISIEYLSKLQKYTFKDFIECNKYDILNIYDNFINTNFDNYLSSDIIFHDNKYYYECKFNSNFSYLVNQVMQNINYINLIFPNIHKTHITTSLLRKIYEHKKLLLDYLITIQNKEKMKKQLLKKIKYNNIMNNIKKEYKELINLKTITDTENFIILCKESSISENIIDIILNLD